MAESNSAHNKDFLLLSIFLRTLPQSDFLSLRQWQAMGNSTVLFLFESQVFLPLLYPSSKFSRCFSRKMACVWSLSVFHFCQSLLVCLPQALSHQFSCTCLRISLLPGPNPSYQPLANTQNLPVSSGATAKPSSPLPCMTPLNFTPSSLHGFYSSWMLLNVWLLQQGCQVFLILNGIEGLYEFFYPFRRPGQWLPSRKGWVVTGRWYGKNVWLNMGVGVTMEYIHCNKINWVVYSGKYVLACIFPIKSVFKKKKHTEGKIKLYAE